MKQFKRRSTFFDLGLTTSNEGNSRFVTVEYRSGGNKKKRIQINRLIVSRLKNCPLSNKDKDTADQYITGGEFVRKKKGATHCDLCSKDYVYDVLFVNYSSKLKYWDISFPTHPYSPAGLMICLRERKKYSKEFLYQLSNEEYSELLRLPKLLYEDINPHFRELCGVNILFQQITTSQACLHGHVELMFKNVDNLSLGAKCHNSRGFDIVARILNTQVDNEFVMSFKEGVKFDIQHISPSMQRGLIKRYVNNTKSFVRYIRGLQAKYSYYQEGTLLSKITELGLSRRSAKNTLYNLSPTPINYIYFTFYRERTLVSIVPEVVLRPIDLNVIKMTEASLYQLKCNERFFKGGQRFLIHKHPMVRLSTKLNRRLRSDKNVSRLKNEVKLILEES